MKQICQKESEYLSESKFQEATTGDISTKNDSDSGIAWTQRNIDTQSELTVQRANSQSKISASMMSCSVSVLSSFSFSST